MTMADNIQKITLVYACTNIQKITLVYACTNECYLIYVLTHVADLSLYRVTIKRTV